MRPRVREADGQRGLPIFAFVDRDAGGGTAERPAAVGADHQRCAAMSRRLASVNVTASACRVDAAHFVLDHAQALAALPARCSSAATRWRFSML